MKHHRIIRPTAIAAATILATLVQSVHAQQARTEKIEVTGSHIKRIDSEGVSPVQVITKDDIEQSGKSTVAEVMKSLAINAAASLNEVFTNSFSPGAAGLSLRGLGQKSTLVLINGRRMANFGFAQNLQDTYVDLNSIPATAVQRIEVLKDGASAVYGSDAIGGVVNIILRSDYEGGEVGASVGTSTEGGMDESRVSLGLGFGNLVRDRYNVLGTVDYFQRDLLLASERDFTKDQDTRRFPGGLLNWGSNATYRTNPRQAFPSCGVGNPGVIVPGSQLGSSGNLCAYNTAPYITLFPKSERLSALGRATFDISPSLTAFAELAYSDNKTFIIGTPSAVSPTSVAYNPLTGGTRSINGTLPVGNSSNPFTVPVGINYTFFDVGNRNSDIESTSYRLLGGLKGQSGGWDWDLGLMKAENEVEQINYNRVDAYVLTSAIANNTYNFLNPSAGSVTAAQLRINPVRKSTSKLDAADFKASRELTQLAGGPMGMAVGIEHRRESIQDVPDPLISNGNVLGQGAVQTDGSRSNTAGFVEFSAPVSKSLELQLAGRYDKYSDFGNAFSPKLAFKWTVDKTLAIRGAVSRGFRAPTLPENSKSAATFFTAVLDTLPSSPNTGRLVNIAGSFASNTDLNPERSKHFNLGMVWEPVPDFNLGLTWYKIRQNGIVQASGFQFIVNNPNLFPGQILRAADGTLISVADRFRNIEFLETSGFDLDFRKTFNTKSYGKFTVAGDWIYISSFRTPPAEGQPAVDYVDSNGFPPTGSGIPRYRGRLSLNWQKGDFSTTLTRSYNHSWDQQGTSVPPAQERVGAYRQYDLHVAYQAMKNLKLSMSVQNLLDTEPPFDPTNGGTGTTIQHDVGQYDLRGRYVTLGLKYTFK
ncbi:MAG: TonB-dependent receptor [Betaproteobacteria bacterium]|nr:TonB-dependent receptor [Betaproteobacteria bacterium]